MNSSGQGPSTQKLLMAQSTVREAMERQWYALYIDSLSSKDEKAKEGSGTAGSQEADQGGAIKAAICIEHTVRAHTAALEYVKTVRPIVCITDMILVALCTYLKK